MFEPQYTNQKYDLELVCVASTATDHLHISEWISLGCVCEWDGIKFAVSMESIMAGRYDWAVLIPSFLARFTRGWHRGGRLRINSNPTDHSNSNKNTWKTMNTSKRDARKCSHFDWEDEARKETDNEMIQLKPIDRQHTSNQAVNFVFRSSHIEINNIDWSIFFLSSSLFFRIKAKAEICILINARIQNVQFVIRFKFEIFEYRIND